MDVILFPDISQAERLPARGFGNPKELDATGMTLQKLTRIIDPSVESEDICENTENVFTVQKIQRLRVVNPTRRHHSYKVTLRDAAHGQERLAICKVAWDASIKLLQHEAEVYETQLKELQGTVVPVFYGLFYGELDGTLAYVLVEEYCGRKPTTIAGKDEVLRKEIFIAVLRLHMAGFEHWALRMYLNSSIRISDTDSAVRIVDFLDLEPHAEFELAFVNERTNANESDGDDSADGDELDDSDEESLAGEEANEELDEEDETESDGEESNTGLKHPCTLVERGLTIELVRSPTFEGIDAFSGCSELYILWQNLGFNRQWYVPHPDPCVRSDHRRIEDHPVV